MEDTNLEDTPPPRGLGPILAVHHWILVERNDHNHYYSHQRFLSKKYQVVLGVLW